MKKLRRFVKRALALLLAGTLGLSMAPEMTARAAGTESGSEVTKSAFVYAQNMDQADWRTGIIQLRGSEITDSGTPQVWATGMWGGWKDVSGYNWVHILNTNPDVATATYRTEGGKLYIDFKPGTASGVTRISVGVDAQYPHDSLGTFNMNLNFDYTVYNGTGGSGGSGGSTNMGAEDGYGIVIDLATQRISGKETAATWYDWYNWNTDYESFSKKGSSDVGMYLFYKAGSPLTFANRITHYTLTVDDPTIAAINAKTLTHPEVKELAVLMSPVGLKTGETEATLTGYYTIPGSTREYKYVSHLYIEVKDSAPIEEITIAYKDGDEVLATDKGEMGNEFTIAPAATKAGYSFKGWSKTKGGTPDYQPGQKVTFTQNTDLYAVWEESEPTTYIVCKEYYVNGERIARTESPNIKGKVGEKIIGSDLAAGHPEWASYTWDSKTEVFEYKESNPTELVLDTTDKQAITLRYELNTFDNSKMEVIKTPSERYPAVGKEFKYTITVKNGNNSPVTVKVTDKLPDKLELQKDGNDNWRISAGGTYDEATRTVTWENVTVPKGSKELYIWVKANSAGDITNEAKAEWNGGSASGNTSVTSKDPEISYTLQYKALEADENEVTGLPASETKQGTVPGSVEFTLSSQVPIRDGYTFAGWDGDVGYKFGGEKVTAIAETLNTVSVTKNMYATWVKNPTHEDVRGLVGAPVRVVCDTENKSNDTFGYDKEGKKDRVTIAEVQRGANGSYTCQVTFIAQEFCDAYNGVPGIKENHRLAEGQENVTLTLTWDRSTKTWKLPVGFTSPVTIHVVCGSDESDSTKLVIVKKFVGVDTIPTDFAIKYSIEGTEYTLNEANSNSTGMTLKWTITIPKGTKLALTEEGTDVQGKTLTVAVTGALAESVTAGTTTVYPAASSGSTGSGSAGNVQSGNMQSIEMEEADDDPPDVFGSASSSTSGTVSGSASATVTVLPSITITNTYTDAEPNIAVAKKKTELEDGTVKFDVTVENTGNVSLYNLMLVDTMDKTLEAVGDMEDVQVTVTGNDGNDEEAVFMGTWENAKDPVRNNGRIVWTDNGGVSRKPDGEDKWDFTWVLGGEFKVGAKVTLTYTARIIYPENVDSVEYYNYADAIAGTDKDDVPRYDGPNGISTYSFVSGGSGSVGGGSGPVGGTSRKYRLTYDFTGGEQNGESSHTVEKWSSSGYYTFTVDGSVQPTREGYTLKTGWANAKENASTTYQAGAPVIATADKQHVTIYAVWEADEAKIQFEENGGSNVKDMTGTTGEAVTERNMPETTRESYTFDGWYDNEELTGMAVTILPDKFPAGTTTYYAKWTHNHDWHEKKEDGHIVWADGKAPDCIHDGTAIYECSCGATKEEVNADSRLGHDFTNASAKDNCSSQSDVNCTGHTQTCQRCNGTLPGGTKTEAHSYGEWTVTKQPTGAERGEQQHTCTVCGHVEKEELAALGEVTITVNFVDEEGNVVGTEIKKVTKGSGYDVTEEAGKIPKGYEPNGVSTGDPVKGTADADKTVTVPVKKIVVTVKDTDKDGNKGTWTENPGEDKKFTPDNEGKVKLPGKGDITPPDGKELDKWIDGTNEYAPGTEITPTGDVILTPVWKDKEPEKPETITATWKNGATDETIQTKEYSEGTSIADIRRDDPAVPAAPEGKEFDQWVVTTASNGDVIITATYKDREPEKPETITVTWKNGETGDILKEVQDRYPKGTPAESISADDYPVAPQVDGKDFKEWTFEVDADGNITITATYEAKEDPAPVEPDPENPTPTIEDIRGLIQVMVTDAGATDHGTVTYQGSQIDPSSIAIGNVRDNGDGTFSCDVTISPAWYVSSYSAGHGHHTLAAGQQPKTVTLSYSALAEAAVEETGETPAEEASKVEAAEIEGEAQEAEAAAPEENEAEAAAPEEDEAEAAAPEAGNAEAADPAEDEAEAAVPEEDEAEAAAPEEDEAEAAVPEEDEAEAAALAEGNAEATDPAEENAEAADPAEENAEVADSTDPAEAGSDAAGLTEDSVEASNPAERNTETTEPAEDSAKASDPAEKDAGEAEGIVELVEESAASGKWTLANSEDGNIIFIVSCASGTQTPDPEDPTNPENPGTSEQPEEPTDPVTPTNPEQPTNPTEPVTPTNPEQPTNPTEPVNPTNPEQPTNPTGPVTPANPEQPTNPANPMAPADTTPVVPAPAVVATTPAVAAPATPVPPTVPAAEEEEPKDVDIPDEETPQAEPETESEAQPEDDPIVGGLEDLAEDETPLALGEGSGRSWALLNLILTILTALASLLMLTFYFVGKRREDEDEDSIRAEEEEEKLKRKGLVRLLSILPAAFAVITFILTEDMRNPMAFVDKWTLLMLLYAVANAVLAFLAVKKWEKEDERVPRN